MSNSTTPTVSVILPTHNRADVLDRAIRSVLNQTYSNLELIVVDAASSDGTPEVVQAIDDKRLRCVRLNSDPGPAATRNEGIEVARGKYIAFVDDDDEWDRTKLAKQVSVLKESAENVALVYCWMKYVYEDGNVIEYQPTVNGDIFERTLDGQPIGNTSTLLVTRSAVERVSGFDEALWRGDDGDFIRRLAKRYNVDYVPELLVTYHTDHDHGRITNQRGSGVRDAIKAQKKKLEKFESEYREYPSKRAHIYAILAYRNAQIGDWKGMGYYAVQALITAPVSVDKYRLFFSDARSLLRGHP